MATTELTGAEEVAWDLGDLYDGTDDPRIEADIAQAEADAGGVPRALPREGRRARRAGARRRGRRARADRVGGRPAADVRAPPLRDEHGRPDARRTRRAARREGRGARHPAPLLRARVGRRPGRRGRRAARRRGARPLAAPPPLAPEVPPVPPHRAGGEGRHREDRLRRRRRGRGSTRSSSARSASRSTGDEVSLETAMARLYDADRDVRRTAAEAITEALGPGLRTRTFVFNTILLDKSIDDRLRGYPTWISSRNLANETTDEAVEALVEADDVALRRPAALLPPQGAAARARPPRPLRPLRPVGSDAEKTSWDEARRIVVDAYSDFSDETGEIVAPVLRRPAGSTGRCGPTSGRARSARRPCRASTRTSS